MAIKGISLDPDKYTASYIIYKRGSNYYAKACFEGGIDYKGTNAQTVIQSAITAVFNAGGGKLFIKKGQYDLSGNFQTIPGWAADNGQYLLYTPYNPTTNPTICITIEGELDNLSLPNNSGSVVTSGVIIYNKSPQSPNPINSPFPWVFGAGSIQAWNNVSVTLKNVIFRQDVATATSNTVNGVNLISVPTHRIENVRIDVNQEVSSGAPSSVPFVDPNAKSAVGIQTSAAGYAVGCQILFGVAVIGYYRGIILRAQAECYHLYAAYCDVAVEFNGGDLHPQYIAYLNTNNCPHVFFTVGGYQNMIKVDCVDIQDNTNSGIWIYTIDHLISDGSVGQSLSGEVNASINNGLTGKFIVASGVPFGKFKIKHLMNTTFDASSVTAGTSPYTLPPLPYDAIYVITTVGGMTALTLDGQALFNASFSVGQQIYVAAGHTLVATWASNASVFKVLPQS